MPWDSSVVGELAAAQEIDVIVPAPALPEVRTPIWVVESGGELYIRSWKGAGGRWYRRATRFGAGSVATPAGAHQVRFTPIDDPAVEAAIDAGFRSKYAASPYTEAMIDPPAAGTTLRLDPA
jgi:hypothetical protein